MSLSTKKFSKLFCLLLGIITLGGILRFFYLSQIPPGLDVDEAIMAVNAYSISSIGKDTLNKPFPITIQTIYSSGYTYLTAVSVKLFDLNEFSIRFPAAFLGTLSILIFFLLAKQLFDKKIAFCAAFLLAISPWHIFFSRMAAESAAALFFVILGVYIFFEYIKQKKIIILFLSYISFLFAVYTYHAEKIYVPLLIIYLVISHKNSFNNKKIIISVIFLFIGALPLLYHNIFFPAGNRAGMLLLSKDPYFEALIKFILGTKNAANFIPEILRLILYIYMLGIFWLQKYLIYLSPKELFWTGLNLTPWSSYGLGVFWVFEIPLLFLGIKNYVSHKRSYLFLFFWLLVCLVPSSLTLGDFTARRAISILPALILINANGLNSLLSYLRKSVFLKIILVAVFILNITYGALMYRVHFPIQRAEDYQYGMKQAFEYILAHRADYANIVFDPIRGVGKKNIYDIPDVYFRIYAKYDPARYLEESKSCSITSCTISNLTVREIYWARDKQMDKTLFVGSPWSFPLDELSADEIKEKIFLPNGQLAFLIVDPKAIGKY